AYGHFGRKSEGDYFPWERVDLVDDLKTALPAGRQPELRVVVHTDAMLEHELAAHPAAVEEDEHCGSGQDDADPRYRRITVQPQNQVDEFKRNRRYVGDSVLDRVGALNSLVAEEIGQ